MEAVGAGRGRYHCYEDVMVDGTCHGSRGQSSEHAGATVQLVVGTTEVPPSRAGTQAGPKSCRETHVGR